MSPTVGTQLWKRSLGRAIAADNGEEFRDRLVASLAGLHEKSALLAGEIVRDLPDYTAHDVSHADRLWEIADLIAGPGLTLTPTEAYVFGGACLIHDLGMASAAYVDGLESLQTGERWSDAVAWVLRGKLDQPPTLEEIATPDPEVVRAALGRVLRELHAQHAERLAMTHWTARDGVQHWLIDDDLLRATYGPIIGRIAHSHWWATGLVGEQFEKRLGAPPGAPALWTVRPRIAACLLRLADACHIDASRAPRFLNAIRKPAASSQPHWDFQGHLSPPYPDGDRFVFTGSPFTVDDAEAWWLCADMLGGIDREFRSVDALLADSGEDRFAIRGVAGGDDLERLAVHIPTDGWSPLDARVRVSNVVRLVERLGGRGAVRLDALRAAARACPERFRRRPRAPGDRVPWRRLG